MTLEEAIKTALEYEVKVRDTYADAARGATNDPAKGVFLTLGDEEQGHIDYLNSKLEEWQKTGHITSERLDTCVPSKKAIEDGVKRLEGTVDKPGVGFELEMLRKALILEEETGNFYRRMVGEVEAHGDLFARFLEVEEGHMAIVQAEIDYIARTGFFFDFQEFNMED